MKPLACSLVAVALASCLFADQAAAPNPEKLKPRGYLSDFTNAVSPDSAAAIARYCGRVEQATKVQIALVTIPTLGGEPIEDFSNKLFHTWGIGQKDTKEGVLLLLVINDHKARIEVGYGLEQYIPDGLSGSILRGIRPQLQQQAYGAALLSAAQQMGNAIAKGKGVEFDSGAAAARQPAGGYREGGGRSYTPSVRLPLPLILFLLFAGFSLIPRLISWFTNRGGRSGGSGRYSGRGGGGPYWGGGGFGGYSGGGGWSGGGGGGSSSDSGGGFSGFGGGDSGGGGSSSDW